MKYYFYSRVSTVGQNATRQTENFKNLGYFTPENLFIDKISGAIPFFERPEALKLFEKISSSNCTNCVVVDSIDRLGRNLLDILHTIEIFTKNKISVKCIKEGFSTLLENGAENPIALITISVMGSLAQLSRDRQKEIQKEGIAVAKANGKYPGRKVGSLQSNERLLERHKIIIQYLRKGYTIRQINELTGKSSTTIIKVKKQYISTL